MPRHYHEGAQTHAPTTIARDVNAINILSGGGGDARVAVRLRYTCGMGYKTYTCPIAKTCGGCETLAVPYPLQLKRKQAQVEELFSDLLTQAGEDALKPIVGMDEPLAFRNKAATPFAPGPKGSIRSGFYAKGTHRIVRCRQCLVEDPRCRRTLNSFARTAELCKVSAYDEDKGRGLLRHAVVRAGWKTDELLLTIVANGERLPRERELVRRIVKHAPDVTAVALNTNVRRTNAILGPTSRALYGGGVMHDELLGVRFEIGPTSFYQTNPSQTERLYRLAIEGAGLSSGMRVLDAYCGIGTIGMCAAAQVDGLQVTGVEVGQGAVGDARRNARNNGLDGRCRFVCADATAFMRDAATRRERYDVVIMDPPRAGSTPEFLSGVVALAPRQVVYVSCNAVTQRRDLESLLAGGYQLQSLTPVDMFPHTKHVETVAVLSRA